MAVLGEKGLQACSIAQELRCQRLGVIGFHQGEQMGSLIASGNVGAGGAVPLVAPNLGLPLSA